MSQSRVLFRNGKLFIGEVAGGSFEAPSLINIRPLTMEFFEAIDQFLKDAYDGCQCKLVGAFNRALGCEKAGAMHLDLGNLYQREDWLDHFHEEDVIELPLLVAMSRYDSILKSYAVKIDAEHVAFRRQVTWGVTAIEEHAALEDRAMKRLIEVMKRVISDRA